jgi:eukaryotic-like serine/threonine-protein kinase
MSLVPLRSFRGAFHRWGNSGLPTSASAEEAEKGGNPMNVPVEELFHEVADLSGEARARYFEQYGIGTVLQQEVEALVAFDSPFSSTLEKGVGQIAQQALARWEPKPQRCGPYRLLRLLGHGGMGSVYLAERADGEVEQRVAIKLLRYGSDEPAFRDRFLRERQILATLNHPTIARLLDAGHTDDGHPYLAMEYIDGDPIDVYAEQLDQRAKLELFRQVCDAVSYAHRNLIVHRDLKPSNILVDREGRPKLLDFGIAKILDADQNPERTATVFQALTPQYASPEQARGETITTATDVYSLGVVLYQLLTGRMPYEFPVVTTVAIARTICEAEPAPPHLSKDLDNILLMALRKEPARRYVSVQHFADDISRALSDRPVLARPDTVRYRATKFVRRHRTAVLLAGLALVASIIGVWSTLIQAHTARTQRDFALRQLARAEAINNLNAFVLSDAAPSGKPFTVDDLLGRAESIVQRQTSGGASRVNLLVEIGRQYTVLDEYAKARRVLEQAYRLSRALQDVSIRAQASCALAQTLSRLGDPPRAEQLFQEGLNALPEEPLYALDRISCLERGSEIARNRGASNEAVERAQAARDWLKQVPIPSELAELNTLITLASSYSKAGRYREANSAFEQAATGLAALGRDSTKRAATLFNNWGVLLILAGRPLEAEKVLRRAIDIDRADHTETTVQPMPLVNYARVLYELGQLDEAADYAERGYAQAQQAGDETAVNQVLLLQASIYRSKGDIHSAGRVLSEVEPRLHRTFPAGHLVFASLASERALNAQAAGDLPLALQRSEQAVAVVEALVKAGRQGADRLSILLTRRSEVELRIHRLDDAAADAARAVGLLQKNAEPGMFSSTSGRAYFALGRALQAKQKGEEACAAFRSAADHLARALGFDHPDARAARRWANPESSRSIGSFALSVAHPKESDLPNQEMSPRSGTNYLAERQIINHNVRPR